MNELRRMAAWGLGFVAVILVVVGSLVLWFECFDPALLYVSEGYCIKIALWFGIPIAVCLAVAAYFRGQNR